MGRNLLITDLLSLKVVYNGSEVHDYMMNYNDTKMLRSCSKVDRDAKTKGDRRCYTLQGGYLTLCTTIRLTR